VTSLLNIDTVGRHQGDNRPLKCRCSNIQRFPSGSHWSDMEMAIKTIVYFFVRYICCFGLTWYYSLLVS